MVVYHFHKRLLVMLPGYTLCVSFFLRMHPRLQVLLHQLALLPLLPQLPCIWYSFDTRARVMLICVKQVQTLSLIVYFFY
jgi:hypothetical protein